MLRRARAPRPSAPPVFSRPRLHAFTGHRLGRAVLAYVGCVIAVITLEPFAFTWPTTLHVILWDRWSPIDPIANVLLFLPVGFLYALTRSATDDESPLARERTLRRGTLLGCLASASIEVVQLFEPARYPSPTDVATNTLGMALGILLFQRAARRFRADGPVVGRLALELPLMGLVYLLLPLCALAALTAAAGEARTPLGALPPGWAVVVLALFGGTLLGQIQRRHFGPSGLVSRNGVAALSGAWLIAGAFPAVATAPVAFAVAVAAGVFAAWWHGADVRGVRPIERRFETAALAHAVPWLVVYLTLVPTEAATPALGKVAILRVVESLAGFTVLGYVLAEAWGRLELRYRHTAWRIALVGVAAALVREALAFGPLLTLVSVPTIVAHVIAAGYGGWIYHMQRAHVLALVAARRSGVLRERRSGSAA